MTRLAPVKPRKLEKLILRLGFKPLRQKGSHVFYEHPDGRTTTIPFHGDREISAQLLKPIMAEIKLSREEFLKLLNE